MNTLCGIRGTISPEIVDLDEAFQYNKTFFIRIKNNVFEISYEKATDREEAKNVGLNFIKAWSIRNKFKIKVDFNQSWEPTTEGNKVVSIFLSDTVSVASRITTTVTETGIARIIKQTNDSLSFLNDIGMVEKCENDVVLSKALGYYYCEVSDDERPLYGIYKTLEQLVAKLGGRKKTCWSGW